MQSLQRPGNPFGDPWAMRKPGELVLGLAVAFAGVAAGYAVYSYWKPVRTGLVPTPSVVLASSDLQPEVGQSTTCTVSGVGETINLKVTVTEVSGGQVNYSFEQA